jgi:hypothetical protein
VSAPKSGRRRNTITWVKPPEPAPVTSGRLGPCFACRCGNHHLCTKVGCYRCPPVHHPRSPGNAATASITLEETDR